MLLFGVLMSIGPSAFSQTKTRILLVLDASGSMSGQWGGRSKWDIAKEILFQTIDSTERANPNVEFGLRVFGHQSPKDLKDCFDSKFEVPFRRGNAVTIRNFLDGVTNQGHTPIAYSLSQAVNDFPTDLRARKIIVLITDGIETCEGDACALAPQFRARGIALRPFVVGMGIGEIGKEKFDCVGLFIDSDNKAEFSSAMDVVITQASYVTTAQINLLDQSGMPTETDVEVTLYDAHTSEVVDHYVHALRSGGMPDTLSLDPDVTYDLTVHTVPPVRVTNIELIPGKHNIIAAQAPQGFLVLKTTGTYDASSTQCVVRLSGEAEILDVQNLNTRRRYLVGNYDLEVLTLPRLHFNSVRIANGKESEILIPEPGILQFKTVAPGLLSVFMTLDRKPVKIFETELSESQYLRIQPGDYEIVFRTNAIRSARLTQVKKVKVGPKSNVLVQF
jgi:Ca-activated chloride channel family protein